MKMEDKGIRQAMKQQPAIKLPSNFNYRMMQRLNAQIELQERQMEKRIFIAWILTVTTMLGGCIGYLGWMYFMPLSELCTQLRNWMPSPSTLAYALPTLISLILIAIFNHWLQKKLTQKELKP